MADHMTPEQKRLARHALGLDGERKVSWRNRFFLFGGPTHKVWAEMVASGWADFDGDRLFTLTRKGAELALEPGESLDEEDFPNE